MLFALGGHQKKAANEANHLNVCVAKAIQKAVRWEEVGIGDHTIEIMAVRGIPDDSAFLLSEADVVHVVNLERLDGDKPR